MGLFKSLFGGNNTPETEKEKNDKKNFEILKYDGIRAQRMPLNVLKKQLPSTMNWKHSAC